MSEQPRIETRPARTYLSIPASGEIDEFMDAAGCCFPELFGQAAELGITPSGPHFIRYLVLEPEGRFEVEFGLPIGQLPSTTEPLHHDSLPAGRYAIYLHRGAYKATTARWRGQDLPAAYDTVRAWAREAGIEWAPGGGGCGPYFAPDVETYVVGPPGEPDPERWRTELAYLIEPN